MRVEDFKKTVERRKEYVEQRLVGLKQKFNISHSLMFGKGAVGYKRVMAENKGKDFYETKEGKHLEKLGVAVRKRENELKAIEAYLETIK